MGRYRLSGAVLSKYGDDDADVEKGDDDERQQQREKRVDDVDGGQRGRVATQRRADPSTARPQLRHARRPRTVAVRGARECCEPDDGSPGFDGRAQRQTTQWVVNGDEALDRKADHVPNTEEAANVGDVGERLAGAVQQVDVDRRVSSPRQHHASQKADAGDADRGQVDAGRAPLHRALAEHEQRDEVAEKADNDDDRCDEPVKQASDDHHRTTASETTDETSRELDTVQRAVVTRHAVILPTQQLLIREVYVK